MSAKPVSLARTTRVPHVKPVIFGCAGPSLSEEEKAFFQEVQPFGFILFKRNIQSAAQLSRLVRSLREAVGRDDASVWVDQEGGRVARLGPPLWPALPPMHTWGLLYEKNPGAAREAVYLHAALIASMLRQVGITGTFAPVLDLFLPKTSPAIGDRAFSDKAEIVGTLGMIFVEAALSYGVFPVIKHMPGHGRAEVDPHYSLPRIQAKREALEADLAPFHHCRMAPLAMNCHALFEALDPERPASLSPRVHDEIIRGAIDFRGILFSDDLAMEALQGRRDRLASEALAAGADIILHCSGELEVMRDIAAVLPPLSMRVRQLWDETMALLPEEIPPVDFEEMYENLRSLQNEVYSRSS